MKEKDIYRLAVRLLGLVFLYHGLQPLPQALIQFWMALMSRNIGAMLMSLAVVIWPLVVASWLLRGAPLLLRLTYGETADRYQSGAEKLPPQYPEA